MIISDLYFSYIRDQAPTIKLFILIDTALGKIIKISRLYSDLRHFAQQNRPTQKNELCCIRRKLKKNIVRKVLRLMVTRYVWNMIAFLRCHYAYLSIILTRLKSQFCALL